VSLRGAGLTLLVGGLLARPGPACAAAEILFETSTPYHHIEVVEEGDLRLLCFDGAQQTRMSLRDPLAGHFSYTEFFHLVWLWQSNLTNVLMVGLGGGSAQRGFAHYYPDLVVETVELINRHLLFRRGWSVPGQVPAFKAKRGRSWPCQMLGRPLGAGGRPPTSPQRRP
jgi:hypothetical protein